VPGDIRFGRFEIRPDGRLLLADGRPVALGPRDFDLLMVLVERRDRIVTRDELLDAVWPGRVVEPNNVDVHVSAVRKAIGRGAILTIPGRGYRFVARVESSGEPPREPAPPAPSPRRNPLPPDPGAALVGRDEDRAELLARWRRAGCLTVVGAGGMGKTWLACAVAHARQPAMRDGAAWVDLTEVTDALQLAGELVQALHLHAPDGGDPWPAIVEELRPLELLLVLDNAEHLLEATAELVGRLRANAPGIDVLVTSQAPLRVAGEQVFRLGPLAVPAGEVDAGQARAFGAVALFDESARAADRRFRIDDGNVSTVVALCRALDGVPLALKLAAARLPALGLAGLTRRLGDRLRLLGPAERGAPARQQTLLAALDWSHGLLDAPTQAVFRRLAVFSGGFPLDAVAPVAGEPGTDEWHAIDALAELVDRSLVGMEPGELPRYRLAETARAYARLQLEAAHELAATQRRHAEAMAARMDAAYEAYWSCSDAPWLASHDAELDNVRAALEWATPAQPALAVSLAGSAGVLFMLLGHAPEARRRFAALEPAALDDGAAPASARYWLERSRLQWGIAGDEMLAFARRAAGQFRVLGDRRGEALALRCAIGSEALDLGEASAALARMVALEPAGAPPRWQAQRLMAEAVVLRAAERLEDACAVGEALVELTTRAGLDGMAAAALAALAGARLAAGDAHAALALARRLLEDPRARRGNFLLHPLGTLAEAFLMRCELASARAALARFAAESRAREWEWLGVYAGVFAWLAACEGRGDDAARLLGYAERAARRLNARLVQASAALPRARAAVESMLDAVTLAARVEEGARLDEAAMCALALRDAFNDPDGPTDLAGPSRPL